MAKVSSAKFMGASHAAGSALAKKVDVNSKKITLLKNIIKAQKIDIGKKLATLSKDGNPLDNSIESIKDSVLSIKTTLIQQQKLDKGQADDDAIAAQQKKRNLKEKLGETVKGAGNAIKGTAQKVIAPVQGLFDQMFGWLGKLFAAKVVMEMMDWFNDENNIGKIDVLVRFAKDWWPVLLTAVIGIVAAIVGPTGIVIGLSVLLLGFIPKIIDATKKFLGMTKGVNKEAKDGEKAAELIQKDMGSEQDLKPEVTEETIEEKQGGGTNEEPPLEMNRGGQVPGSGDRDTVPAMLTPGEFVMSKGAVEQYGSDTLAGMNAMAGGSNKPSGGHYSGGGQVKHPAKFLDKISPLSKKENREGIISKGFGFLKDAFGGGRKSKSLGKGGLSLFIDKISNLPIVGPKMADAGKELVVGVQDMIQQQHVSMHKSISLSPDQQRREGVDAPTKPPVTVAYANAADKADVNASAGAKAVADSGVKIPSFSAGEKISPYKVAVLGISR